MDQAHTDYSLYEQHSTEDAQRKADGAGGQSAPPDTSWAAPCATIFAHGAFFFSKFLHFLISTHFADNFAADGDDQIL